MAAQPLSSRKGSSAKRAELSPEDLIRLLIDQLTDSEVCGLPIQRDDLTPPSEDILFTIDLNGARYLLVRLTQTNRARVRLSPREQEIVRMVAQGHPKKIIADVLSISSWTVCTHLRRIFAKLGVGSRAAMVARLLENRGGREQMIPSLPLAARSSTTTRNSPTIASHRSRKLASDLRSELTEQRVR